MAIMKSEGPAVWYDRRVSPQLREALMPGGSLHRLITFARRRHLADVQLRKARSGSPSWVSVYGGLTKFLDIQHAPSKGFRLMADKRYMGPAHARSCRSACSAGRPGDCSSSSQKSGRRSRST